MSELYDTLRKLIRQELASLRIAELATVQEVFPADPDNYACDLAMRDSQLVLKQVPLLTPRKGFASLPDVGDLVLVQFVGGDINRPLIIGTLYNDEDRPPENAAQQAIFNLPAQNDPDSALHLELNETGPMSLKLNIGSALELTLQDDDPVVKLDVGGNAALIIDRGGAVTLESNGDLSLKGASNVQIEAAAELNLKGAIINLN
jgi:phage baseplate assembly protein gpV